MFIARKRSPSKLKELPKLVSQYFENTSDGIEYWWSCLMVASTMEQLAFLKTKLIYHPEKSDHPEKYAPSEFQIGLYSSAS